MTTPLRLSLLLLLDATESVTDAVARHSATSHVDIIVARVGDRQPVLSPTEMPNDVIDAGVHDTRGAALAAAIEVARTGWLVATASGTVLMPDALPGFQQAIAGGIEDTPILGQYLGAATGKNASTPLAELLPDTPILAACAGQWPAQAPMCLPIALLKSLPSSWTAWRRIPEFALSLEAVARAGGLRMAPSAGARPAPDSTSSYEVAAILAESGLVLDKFLESRRFEELVPPAAAGDMQLLIAAARTVLSISIDLRAPLHAGVGPSPVLAELLRSWLQRTAPSSLRAEFAKGAVQLVDAYSVPPTIDEALRSIDQPAPIIIAERVHRVAREQARAVGVKDTATAEVLADWLLSSPDIQPDTDTSARLPRYKRLTRVEMYRTLDLALHEGGDIASTLRRAFELFPNDPMWSELQAIYDSRGTEALRARLGFTRPWHLNAIPRIAHFYWGGERTSFLRYFSVASFRRANPDWEIRVHVPRSIHKRSAEWNTSEAYEGSTFFGRDYSLDLFALPDVEIVEVDFDGWPALAGAAETFKSDYFRWHVLATEGGLYSDADIAYHRPVRYAAFNSAEHSDARVGLCAHYGFQFIGFILAAPGTACFEHLLAEAPRTFDLTVYQSLGSHLVQRCFPNTEALAERYPEDRPFNIDMDVVYAFDWRDIEKLHVPGDPKSLPSGAIGIHWYGGAGKSQHYNEQVSHVTVGHHGSLLDSFIARVTTVLPDPPGRRRFPVRTRGTVRFSVLVPSYQQAHYLPATLESVLNQTWEDFEVVVVDDGSTDDTREVIADWMARDSRVRGFTQANGGTGAALNTALANARGDRICWLSSDDLYEPTALATFADAQGIWPDARFFHANFSMLHEAERTLEARRDFHQLSNIPAVAEQTLVLLRANYVNGITICIDRALVQEMGGWDTQYRWAQDFDLWLRLSLRTPMQYIDARVARTRIHEGQDTKKAPMFGMWDSARAVHALLARNDFASLTPFANLENDEGMMRALSTVALTMCDPNAFVFQGVGPNVVLLGHVSAWAAGSRRRLQIVQAMSHMIEQSVTAPTAVREMASVLRSDPGGLRISPVPPLQELRRRLSGNDLGAHKSEMTRYLQRITQEDSRRLVEAQPIHGRRRIR